MAIAFKRCPTCGKAYKDDRKACPYCRQAQTQAQAEATQESAPETKRDDADHTKARLDRIKRMAEKSLPVAIGLNFVFPGIGYFYLGQYSKGVLALMVVFAIAITEPMMFIFSASMGLGVLMGIDMLILHKQNQRLVSKILTRKCPMCAEMVQIEARKCRFCGADLPEVEASVLPRGYALNLWARMVTAGLGCILLIALVAVIWQTKFKQSGTATATDTVYSVPMMPSENQIQQKVIDNAEAQYNIAKRQGTQMDTCVQAGIVAAAYLQAKKEDSYKRWKDTEAYECNAAGMPR